MRTIGSVGVSRIPVLPLALDSHVSLRPPPRPPASPAFPPPPGLLSGLETPWSTSGPRYLACTIARRATRPFQGALANSWHIRCICDLVPWCYYFSRNLKTLSRRGSPSAVTPCLPFLIARRYLSPSLSHPTPAAQQTREQAATDRQTDRQTDERHGDGDSDACYWLLFGIWRGFPEKKKALGCTRLCWPSSSAYYYFFWARFFFFFFFGQ